MSSPSAAPCVVVSGIGLTTPLGLDRETSWRALCAGRSAVRRLAIPAEWPEESADDGRSFVGAPALSLPENGDGEAWRDPVVELALRAAREALHDARLDPAAVNRYDMGCAIGTSKGGLRSFTRRWQEVRRGGPTTLPVDVWSQFLPSAPAATVAASIGAGGAALCPVAACATGLVSLQRGYELVRDGTCRYVLAGSTDASLHGAVLAAYRRLGVLAAAGDDPAAACRPFDRTRRGFVIGEGAAVVLFERLETARARGVRPYAEWLGGALLSDAAGLLSLDPDAAALTRLIADALHRAQVTPDDLDYVNLHGTATRPNDPCETRAVRQALGTAARRVACSGLKGGLGHLLGAAGSVEMAATLLALRDGIVPPTVNLRDPDPACDLDYTPRTARRQPLRCALKLSLGFGGHLAAAVVRHLDGDARPAAYR